MNTATVSKKILSLFIAVLYLFFSCVYVTRCAKDHNTSNKQAYSILNKSGAKIYHSTISHYDGNKSVPFVLLSRPRVISGKNLILFATPFLRFAQTRLFFAQNQSITKNFFRNFKTIYSDNIFSLIRTWKI